LEGSPLPRDKQAILRELLVLRCKRGERQAFDELVRQWEGRLLYYVRRLVATEEDAWDVLQQVWIKVFKGIKSLDAPQRLPAWLYQIARCTAVSHWRGHYRTQARMEDNSELQELAGAEESFPLEDAELVHHALGRISLAHREVLTLYFLEDLSLEEMAEVLDIPLGTVKSRLCYAKRALRAALEREEGHP
jgi:RNA polymerase sigma factor (sigma-70 family)